MSKRQREPRLEIILQVLRNATESLTLSEIYEEIKTGTNLDVSQKTIEREIFEMIQKGIIIESSIKPRKVSLWGQFGAIVHLSHEEITYLIVALPESHPLNIRLKRLVGIFDGERVIESN
jgi:hypothetical protein